MKRYYRLTITVIAVLGFSASVFIYIAVSNVEEASSVRRFQIEATHLGDSLVREIELRTSPLLLAPLTVNSAASPQQLLATLNTGLDSAVDTSITESAGAFRWATPQDLQPLGPLQSQQLQIALVKASNDKQAVRLIVAWAFEAAEIETDNAALPRVLIGEFDFDALVLGLTGISRATQESEVGKGTNVLADLKTRLRIFDATAIEPNIDSTATDRAKRRLLYSQEGWSVGPIYVEYSVVLPNGDRWAAEIVPAQGYIYHERSWTALILLCSGLALTGFIVLSLSITAQRTEQIRELVQRRTQELHDANKQLAQLTLTDALTSLVNRRGFDQALELEWGRALRERKAITLMIIDVDHFKSYNDHYGHIAGDECLKAVAQAIGEVPGRLGDLVARYGGEEFAVLLPNTDDVDAVVAERCRAAVEQLHIEHGHSDTAKVVTVSVGVASMQPHLHPNSVDLVQQADVAMYQAKKAGRNRVVRL